MLQQKPRVLILGKSSYNSLEHFQTQKFISLAKHVDLEVVAITHKKDFKKQTHEGFHIRCLYMPKAVLRSKLIANLYFCAWATISTIYHSISQRNYDVVIACDPQLAGPIGLLITKSIRAKLIVELNGNYNSPHVWEDIPNRFTKAIKKKASSLIIPFVLKRTSAIKTLYPEQESPYLGDRQDKHKVFCFHEYAYIPEIPENAKTEDYILSMGYPYKIKGFDILIKAFDKISDQFPGIELHLVGHHKGNDRAELESLKGTNSQIHIYSALHHPEALQKLSGCLFFVLVSRTEAMGRVILEAMGLKKAVIGSDADGIPHYVKDRKTGLVVNTEDPDDLAEKLSILLKDNSLRDHLAANGYSCAHQSLSPEKHIEHYVDMINKILT